MNSMNIVSYIILNLKLILMVINIDGLWTFSYFFWQNKLKDTKSDIIKYLF